MSDFLESFQWHSSIGIDDILERKKKIVSHIPISKHVLANFIKAGDNLLIHRASKALWRISDDKKSIIPVFDTDILTEDDLEVNQ